MGYRLPRRKESIMSDVAQTAIDKLDILKQIAESGEIRVLAKIMIEYIHNKENTEAGFTAKKDQK